MLSKHFNWRRMRIHFHPADDTFTLQPVNRLDTFNRASSSECLELLSQSADGLTLKRKPCLTTTEVYFFSGGKMRPAFRVTNHRLANVIAT